MPQTYDAPHECDYGQHYQPKQRFEWISAANVLAVDILPRKEKGSQPSPETRCTSKADAGQPVSQHQRELQFADFRGRRITAEEIALENLRVGTPHDLLAQQNRHHPKYITTPNWIIIRSPELDVIAQPTGTVQAVNPRT